MRGPSPSQGGQVARSRRGADHFPQTRQMPDRESRTLGGGLSLMGLWAVAVNLCQKAGLQQVAGEQLSHNQ